jgi:hypothetical protein
MPRICSAGLFFRTKAVHSSNAFSRPSCIIVHLPPNFTICSAIRSPGRRRRATCCLQQFCEPDRADGQARKSRARQQRGMASHLRRKAAQLSDMTSATDSAHFACRRAVPAPGSPAVALLSVREVQTKYQPAPATAAPMDEHIAHRGVQTAFQAVTKAYMSRSARECAQAPELAGLQVHLSTQVTIPSRSPLR